MSFGLPPECTTRLRFSSKIDELPNAIKTSLGNLGWKYKAANGQTIIGKIGMSWKSWGENFTINFSEDGTVSFTSKSWFPTTVIDWGKNETNAEQFIAELENVMGS